MTHRRVTVREAVAAAIAAIPATVAQELGNRIPDDVLPLVIVQARDETPTGGGTMGPDGGDERRELELQLHIHTAHKDPKTAVDAANALDEAIGPLIRAADDGGALDALVYDIRWGGTSIAVDDDQELAHVQATVTYQVQYDLPYGDPT